MTATFNAFWVEEKEGTFTRSLTERSTDSLPEGDVLIKVHYSALNYKDALSATGNKGVTRKYPHTPGIDAAGIVEESSASQFQKGQKVIVTSYDLGMNTSGGFGGYIRVPAGWVLPLPEGMSLRESMILGTAGLTAGIGVWKMQQMGQKVADGPIMVSGASGGVGSLAVAILHQAGYEVIGSTGKTTAAAYLNTLGASEIVDRAAINDESGKPLIRGIWAGAIDTVGGNTLATLLKGCKANGSVAACGLVASPSLKSTVFPFIIKGINLLGIDSATCPMEVRTQVWEKLASDWKVPTLGEIVTDIKLEELDTYIEQILAGKTQGRVVVKVS
ncbi:MAG: YhdH/YhfP family quinone oxidoreductase [Bacteroidota bacterium]